MIDAAPNTTALAGGNLPSTTWGRWFRALADWVRRAERIQAFTPVFSGVTGSADYEASFVRVGSVVYFQLAIDPSASWAAVAGVSSVGLPLQAAFDGVAMVYKADGTAGENGLIAGTSLFLPTITTTGRVVVSAVYSVAGGE